MPRGVHSNFLRRKLENRCEGCGGAIDQELRFAARNKPRGHIAAGTGIDFLDPRVTMQILELDGLSETLGEMTVMRLPFSRISMVARTRNFARLPVAPRPRIDI
jgi:hypothetical protein